MYDQAGYSTYWWGELSPPVSTVASLVMTIPCTGIERLTQKADCTTLEDSLSVERESAMKNIASKNVSVWTPQFSTRLCISRILQDPAGRQAADILCLQSFPSQPICLTQDTVVEQTRRKSRGSPSQPLHIVKKTTWKVDHRLIKSGFSQCSQSGKPRSVCGEFTIYREKQYFSPSKPFLQAKETAREWTTSQ